MFEWRRMPFGLCIATALFQRSITGALLNSQQRHGSVVMAYIDDIVIATEAIEDPLMRIKEVFECLMEAGFKMQAENCNFLGTETKYMGREGSAEGIKSDTEAATKIQEWMPPRNKEELQIFLGFANYYRAVITILGAKAQPLQELFKNNQHCYWNEKYQTAAPIKKARFPLDTDASEIRIAGILHQKQEHKRKTILSFNVYGSKSLARTHLNYGASKLEI